jgi:hypothetical protein
MKVSIVHREMSHGDRDDWVEYSGSCGRWRFRNEWPDKK